MLYFLVVIPPLVVFSVHFWINFRFFGFSCHFFRSLFVLQVDYFSAFATCSIYIFGERRLASNGVSTKETFNQCHLHTILTYFPRLWTDNCFLEKYYIRLPMTFLNLYNLINCFTFCIFSLNSVYMCKFISRVSMHQPLVSPPICKQKQSANQSINQSI